MRTMGNPVGEKCQRWYWLLTDVGCMAILNRSKCVCTAPSSIIMFCVPLILLERYFVDSDEISDK